MPSDKICKTIHQYNREPIPREYMEKLVEIAEDYTKVKNYVYTRFGGIGSLSKLYPGYMVHNEQMPSVYFYLAVFEALGDIKSQWSNIRARISKLVGQNEGFTEDEKHYLRFLLKVTNAFDAALNERPIKLQRDIQAQYDCLAGKVDVLKMHRYVRRQVRKYHVKLRATEAGGFSTAGMTDSFISS